MRNQNVTFQRFTGRRQSYVVVPSNVYECPESKEARAFNTSDWKIEAVSHDGSEIKTFDFNSFCFLFGSTIRGFARIQPEQVSFYLLPASKDWAYSSLLADLLWRSTELHTCKGVFRLIRETNPVKETVVELRARIDSVQAKDRARVDLEKLAREHVPFVRRNGDRFSVSMLYTTRGYNDCNPTAATVWRDREGDGNVKCTCQSFVDNPTERCAHILAVKYFLEAERAERANCNWCSVKGSTCRLHNMSQEAQAA